MSSPSFELLAAAAEWEQQCLGDPTKVDNLPDAFRTAQGGAWTFPAQLMDTLAPYAQGKIDPYQQTLASLAKDGAKGKRGSPDIMGYPGLVEKVGVFPEIQDWRAFAEPTPAVLDALPQGSLLLRVEVTPQSPFYSRDDMSFYPTENPLRRHKVFDAPCLSASGVKGLLRWASHMVRQNLEETEETRFLFGDVRGNAQAADNEPTDTEEGTQGALYCYPVFWPGPLGLEVINPQHLDSGAGTLPIKYEVVKPDSTVSVCLHFLLASLPDRTPLTTQHVRTFLQALAFLLQNGGLSAKSSAGWGRVSLKGINAALRGVGQRCAATAPQAPNLVQQAVDKAVEEAWSAFVGADGALLPLEDKAFTKARVKAVLPDCSNKMFTNDKPGWYAQIKALFDARQGTADTAAQGENAQETTATAWMWPEPGATDVDAFTTALLDVLENKEA